MHEFYKGCFVYKILGYFYDEISYDVTEFKIELKI